MEYAIALVVVLVGFPALIGIVGIFKIRCCRLQPGMDKRGIVRSKAKGGTGVDG